LCTVSPHNGEGTVVVALKGYARGLALFRHYAYVGLSQACEQDLFSSKPITECSFVEERTCGVSVVDLCKAEVIAFLRSEADIYEVFDVQVLPGMRWPSRIGTEGDALDSIITAPSASWGKDGARSAIDAR
jgi:uncharacterized protein (TIGR03032 family)